MQEELFTLHALIETADRKTLARARTQRISAWVGDSAWVGEGAGAASSHESPRKTEPAPSSACSAASASPRSIARSEAVVQGNGATAGARRAQKFRRQAPADVVAADYYY